MRVLHVMASNKRGGAELFFARLCIALAEAGLEQRAVIRRGADCRAELLAAGIDVVELPFLSSTDFFSRWKLRRAIAGWSPDVVMSWMSRAAANCGRGPYIHVARLGGYYALKYYRKCDHLIGNTEDIVRYLVGEGWPLDKAHYLPNFVDEVSAPKVDRASIDTPADAPVLLALGRLHSDKAFDILLEALALLPAAVLWLAGAGPLDQALKSQAQGLGVAERVRFLGWRDDRAALLAAADILVCPSRIEPLGNVVLEGWAHGLPVVACASAGPAGLIEEGRTGLLAPIDDGAALARALGEVIADKAQALRLGAAGREEYQAKFGRTAVVRRYLDFFEKVT